MKNPVSDHRTFLPHVTVATVVFNDGKYLLVKERNKEAPSPNTAEFVINQPAGHLEANESLQNAATRETLEETGWQVELTHFIGVSLYNAPNGVTYVRHTFVARPVAFKPELPLDEGILSAQWYSLDDVRAHVTQLRSPLVLEDIERHQQGALYPLAIVAEPK
ncbi:NUDIX hydrolase [Marinibactrum halimedae]|uniref:Phosphatase NudJ n=1 Tax=Marinibactrum halimedae TaxID=1444977 RepID=A0AA37TEA5_9GAMM|nr:NUDIX hydrolase [Marinibactrum halimedae]MCD9460409.1 NUDIX hydrolase [Marinibactrum halimedae]GLS27462.1 NUDIX hydrolase [Marinibactrum halimedae]